MPEYGQFIRRKGFGNQRARDFIDIEELIKKFSIDIGISEAQTIVRQMFALKHVPLAFLRGCYELRADFSRLALSSWE